MNQQTLQLTAGASKSKRRALDFYPTPEDATVALMEFLSLPPCTVWEPACGDGAIVSVLERYGASEFMQRAFSGFTALPESSVIITPQKWWQVLEVSPTAGEDEIKSAYRKKAIETHPDKGGTADQFVIIQKAYEEAISNINQ